MPVKYKVVAKGNPSKPADPKKFYANAVSAGELTFKDIAKQIAAASALTEGDALSAINSFVKAAINGLNNGNIVRLGELGSLSLSIQSTGQATADKVTSNTIDGAKINFRPGPDLKDMIKTLSFEKA